MASRQNISPSFVFLAVNSFLLFSVDSNYDLYYITPSIKESCIKQPCDTLFNLINNITLNDSNITLIFLPGNHTLDWKLKLSSMRILKLRSIFTLSRSKIFCTGFDAKLELLNINYVEFSQLEFIGCKGNKIESVQHLLIKAVIFQSQPQRIATLEIINSIATTMHSYFICIKSYQESLSTNFNTSKGGAVFARQSSIKLINCTFENNSAEIGGAVYGESLSNVTVVGCTFVKNLATNATINCLHESGTGGAIFLSPFNTVLSNSHKKKYENMQVRGTLRLINTTFINNRASNYGGGIAAIHTIVSVQNCTFNNNKAIRGGAIYVISSSTVNVRESKFIYCNGEKQDGHAGAVYAYQSLLLIGGCKFMGNSAAYGGAVDTHYGSISVEDSNFTFNMATYQGGALYIFYASNVTLERCSYNTNFVTSQTGIGSEVRIYKVTLTISNSEFLGQENTFNITEKQTYISKCPQNNTKNKITGVALVIGYSEVHIDNTTLSGRCMSWYAYNCTLRFKGTVTFSNIDSTKSTMLGALSTILSKVEIYNNLTLLCNSAANGGAIHAVESEFDVHGHLRITMNKATNSGGGIYLYRSKLKCRESSNVTFFNNTAMRSGGGINAISSSITVIHMRHSSHGRSQLHFDANYATEGGGLYMEANAKLYVIKIGSTHEITPSVSVVFKGNSAKYGGAIFVADRKSAGICQSTPNTTTDSDVTECFLQVLSFLLVERVPSPEHLVSLEFINNSATAYNYGHALFGGLLDRCTLSPFAEVHHYNGIYYSNRTTYITKVSNFSTNLQSISSKAVYVCFCREGTPNCDYQPSNINVTKGKKFSISLVAVNQVNHTVNHTYIYSSLETSQLDIGQHSQKTTEGCTLLNFSISSPSNVTHDTLSLHAKGPCGNAIRSQRRLNIQFDNCSCPVGFEQDPDHSKCSCVCDSRLKMHEVTCNSRRESIVKEGNFWIQYIHSNGIDGFVIHSPCPNGYCINSNVELKFNVSNSFNNEQCSNRSGILCGDCLPSHSLSIDSSRCVQCPDTWQGQMVGITLTAIIGGIILVAMVMILDLTVATGTINGIIFYANVINSGSIELASPKFAISWLNLELGFDICFIKGLDAYWKTWLQLLFPAYIFLLVALIVLISKLSLKFSRLIGKRNPVATLTTLILLSYTKFLRTITTALSFTTLSYPSGISKTVWLPDANIKYLQGKHIALFIAANLVLLAGMAYTLLLFSWQWLLRHQDMCIFKWVRYQKLQNFLEPYHAPYTYQHRYWTGLLLVIRIALYLTSAINTSGNTDVTLYSITILTSALLFLKSAYNRGIYRKTLPNVIETICFINIVLFCTTNMYYRNSELKVLAYISGTLTTILLLLIVIYHIRINFGIWKKLRPVIASQVTLTSISHRNSGTVSNAPQYTMSVVDGPPSFGGVNSELQETLLEDVDN